MHIASDNIILQLANGIERAPRETLIVNNRLHGKFLLQLGGVEWDSRLLCCNMCCGCNRL